MGRSLVECRVTQPEEAEKAIKATFRIAFCSRGFVIQRKSDVLSMIRIHKEIMGLQCSKIKGWSH